MSEEDTVPVRDVTVQAGDADLEGFLAVPDGATAIVAFAHGSGSSRFSPRNTRVAESLQARALATLLLDLLTPDEQTVDERTRRLRFDIPLLARRLVGAVDWLGASARTENLALGLFGASTGAAAALVAAAEKPETVRAVVSRGGRPDLAGDALPRVQAPTLLIVGGDDRPVIGMNREARVRMTEAETELEIVPGASHLFEEPGALDEVSRLAGEWFQTHLG